MKRMAAAAIIGLSVFGMAFGACGGDDDETDAATTPGAGAKAVRTADADGSVTVVARDLDFDTEEISAPAGAITIVLENDDGGTPHNIHFFAGDDASGESVGESPLNNGPSTDELEMDLAAGAYFFQCDVHPNMSGTLTVG